MTFTLTFIKLFFSVLALISPILLTLCSIIIVLGLVAGRKEGWSTFDTIYWAFITAFTVGYGDIRPLKRTSKVLAVIIAWTGIMFTGVIVAVTVAATTDTVKKHYDPDVLQAELQKLK
ncbi:MAG: two pore domain potassium channel family protein [Halioglobus sp.]|nr:two pore domain potassium channel family protein [Halioglobus sp.]